MEVALFTALSQAAQGDREIICASRVSTLPCTKRQIGNVDESRSNAFASGASKGAEYV